VALYKVSLDVADLATGREASSRLGSGHLPQPLAITLFEQLPQGWRVEAYYDHAIALAAVERELAALAAGAMRPLLDAVPDENWVAVSQAALPPVTAGRIVVHGSHDRARFAMRRWAIEIDAGEAFGTGHNATTALSLEALDRLARRRRFARVLDLGCGSGVLALAAARLLGEACIFASDNDPVALGTARENARRNRLGRQVRIIAANGLDHPALRPHRHFDLVLANIMLGPLIELAQPMRRLLRPGGVAVLSGVLADQAHEIAAAYRAAGFHLLHRDERAGWSVVTVVRP
jgi:ribosomal protein L11 methyltransferase